MIYLIYQLNQINSKGWYFKLWKWRNHKYGYPKVPKELEIIAANIQEEIIGETIKQVFLITLY